MGELEVVPAPWGGWRWVCIVHGHPVVSWHDPVGAAFDALGHVAAHHPLAGVGSGHDC